MLLCLQDHPTQYDPPLWRALHALAPFSVRVWYAVGKAPVDPEILRTADWGAVDRVDSETVPASRLWARLAALRERPRAILVTGWRRPGTVVALAWARTHGVPVIASSDKTLNEPSSNGPWGAPQGLAHALKGRLFDGVFTSGVLGRQQCISAGYNHERIVEGLYPVDISYWNDRLRQLGGRAGDIRTQCGAGPVVLAVCKLSERESPLFVLDSFARFAREHPTARLLQVGDGPLRAEYEAHVARLGLRDRVVLAGYVPYGELTACYGAADVFMHVPNREPWGISVLEAMACGLPVVCTTAVGAAADLVVPGTTGGLGYVGDAASIARALDQAVRLCGPEASDLIRRRVAPFDVRAVATRLSDFVLSLPYLDGAWTAPAALLKSQLLNEFGRWAP